MLSWGNQFNICCFLDSHQYQFSHSSVETVLGAGALGKVSTHAGAAFHSLQEFINRHQGDWLFGHLGYDLKNETENLQSNLPDYIGFPDLCFFRPETVVILRDDEMEVGAFTGHESIATAIMQMPVAAYAASGGLLVRTRFTRAAYIEAVQSIRRHIRRGDCYEMNFCQEFYADGADIRPIDFYRSLCQESPNPFAAYYRLGHRYLLCASPERYLKKMGLEVISQPIKGTSRRDQTDTEKDYRNRQLLQTNPKDQAENIMIVDLVRNDLSKICEEGSVRVEELLAIYSFPQVHQMISTVRGTVAPGLPLTDIIKAAFPMGSMTGAPKKRVMELIEAFERTRRGLFSGSVGYISPEADFDFNVVIRSMLYNAGEKYLSFQTGSAITYQSLPEQEYEECLLKAAAILKVLGATLAASE